jgi:hypothetical protein
MRTSESLAYRLPLLSKIVTNDNRYVNSAEPETCSRPTRPQPTVPSWAVSIPRISRVPGVLGIDHPGTLTSRNGPTVAYQDAGRTAEVKDLTD